jgi:UDP-N-acetylmuramyl pentapeptide phosphotransferase/UDP-N-acetylglucosamine-1-phosphate transferase
MAILIISFIVTFLTTLLVVRYAHKHKEFLAFLDSDVSSVQKFHTNAVPRIGGLPIILGVSLALSVHYLYNPDGGKFGVLLVVSALPAFLFGLLEDFTKKVTVRIRLIATLSSAGFAGYFLNAWLNGVQIYGVDYLMLMYPTVAICVTCFAVGGVAHSFNIIDGYNGLSAMVAVIVLSGITYVALKVGDYSIMIAAMAMVGGLIGFLLWNYPRGSIFLGDGGAYLIGIWIAELSVLLTTRNSEVSKWFPLLLCFYPIFETIFTIYRRFFIKKTDPGLPDDFHLHQLIYKRMVKLSVGGEQPSENWRRNALTSPYLWVLTIFSFVPAVLFWRYQIVLMFFTVLFAITYIFIYKSIVRFKVPSWICIRHNR